MDKLSRDRFFFFSGNFISSVGNAMQFVFNAWFAYTLTGSGLQFAGVLVLSTLPATILGLFLVLLVDRHPPKSMMILADGARALSFGVFLVLLVYFHAGAVELGFLIFINAFFDKIYKTAQRKALKLFPGLNLLAGNSLLSVSLQSGAVIGAGLGGALTAFQPKLVVAINMATFLASILSVSLVPLATAKPSQSKITTIVQELLRALAELRTNRPLGFWYSTSAFFLVLVQLINLQLTPLIQGALHAGALTLGIAEACLSLGTIAGGVLLVAKSKILGARTWQILMPTLLVMAVLFAAIGLVANTLGLFALCLLLGFALASSSLASSRAQELADFSIQATIHSLFLSVSALAILVVTAAMGALMDWIGIRGVLVTTGISVLIFCAYFWRFRPGRGRTT